MVFILPVPVNYQARRYPVVTFTLIGLNAVLYVLGLMLFFKGVHEGTYEGDPLVLNMGLIPEERIWWTWITSLFVHAGFFHFAGNMIYLYLFAACVEDLMGRWQFSLFYLGGGFLASLTQVLLTKAGQSDVPIVGASGAIAACIGAFLVAFPDKEINFRYAGWILQPFSGDFWMKAWIVIAFWFILDFGSLVLDFGSKETGGGIAFGAHVGGTIAGALTMLAARKKLLAPDEDTEPFIPSKRPESPMRVTPAASEPANIFLLINEEQTGPYPPSTVREKLAAGSITNETYFWQESMTEWRPISEM